MARNLIDLLSLITVIIVQLTFAYSKDTFSTISENIFSNIKCVPYAYGDFNGDKRVDIFCVSDQGKQVEIWQALEKEPLFERYKTFRLKNNLVIVNIVPGDFNGDSYMDLLFVGKLDDKYYQLSILYGLKISKTVNELEIDKEKIFDQLKLTDQPLAADLNGDGKIDLLVEIVDEEGNPQRKMLFFDQFGNMSESVSVLSGDFYNGFAHSIVDINNDLNPDLVLTTKVPNDKRLYFQAYTIDSMTNTYVKFAEYPGPKVEGNDVIYGQSIFGDFDSDGTFEHVLPLCADSNCQHSFIYLKKNSSDWVDLKVDFGYYGFVPPNDKSASLFGQNSISLKLGDYNLNGFVDLLTVLRVNNASSANHNDRYAILMKNVEFSENSFGRTFKIDSSILSLYSHKNVVQASFFDLYDDGYLDILLLLKNSEPSETPYQLIALKNEDYDDVYFLKVMVIPGRCSVGQCPFQTLPYGLNYPGALVKIESISFEYQRFVIYSSQLSQSAYMALQLPYTVFGLGSTANFVEHLTVGILAQTTNNAIIGYKKEWPQIIPNSQLVISPSPRDYPYNWKMQLFITPSKNILLTLISLGSTMVCLAIIIGLLQFREKKMDEKERKLESQRFHFDGL